MVNNWEETRILDVPAAMWWSGDCKVSLCLTVWVLGVTQKPTVVAEGSPLKSLRPGEGASVPAPWWRRGRPFPVHLVTSSRSCLHPQDSLLCLRFWASICVSLIVVSLVHVMGQTLGSDPLIPCPLAGGEQDHWIIFRSSWLLLLFLNHCRHKHVKTWTNKIQQKTAIMTDGSLSNRWTATTLLQNFRLLFLIRQFAAQ